MSKFNEGDWAWSPFCGWNKVGLRDNQVYPFNHAGDVFTKDGKLSPGDIAPTLFTEAEAKKKFGLVREKKMKKVKVEGWANIYPRGANSLWFKKEFAESSAAESIAFGERVIAIAIPMTGEYEIEDNE